MPWRRTRIATARRRSSLRPRRQIPKPLNLKSPAMTLLRRIIFTLGCTLALSAFSAAPIELKLDAAKTGAPINPHIYGQFIEHLGRCIYGGIWAEMLEDRKFYFPITANYAPYKDLKDTAFPVVGASPWEIIGSADGVMMEKKDAFAGEHSPHLKAGAGIRQRDLGIVAGKGYNGYVWVNPLAGRAEVEVTLVWGDGVADRATTKLVFTGSGYSKQSFSFVAGRATDKALLEIRALPGTGEVLVGSPSIMPADNFRGLRADTLALLKQLNAANYRWPGGNFVSGYDWHDGIGDRDRRPPKKNPAWTGVEHNDFGTDEFIAFCREVGAEPLIAVNTGFGDAYTAAQWVEYCNGSPSTLAGSWRAKNGSDKPYGVKLWGVGNEMYGHWQLGFMQFAQYTIKHNIVADAMWKVDPSAVLIGVGDINRVNTEYDPDMVKAKQTWSKGMLEQSGDKMNVMSEHFYQGRVPWTQDQRVDLLKSVTQLKDNIRLKADGHRKLQPTIPELKGRIMPIAMDEWNYWHRDYVYGELGCVYELADGLGVAEGLHEYFRQSDLIHMANYAQTVNVIGAIKTTKTAAEMETTGLVLQLYRAKYGEKPLVLEKDFAPYDIAAAFTKDGKTLTVGVVNPTNEEIQISLAPTGLAFGAAGSRYHITGANDRAHNTPGQPRVVDIQRTDGIAASAPLRVPALSNAVFTLPLK
jgi:alpha-L-arabinofuranosidase